MNQTSIDTAKIISSLNGVYCELRPSSIQGIGVFAIREIPIGTNPFSDDDEVVVDKKDIPEFLLPTVEKYCYSTPSYFFVPRLGFNHVNLLRYLNHSKEPNMVLNEDGSFISLRAISKDEELTFDYDEAYGETHDFNSPGDAKER